MPDFVRSASRLAGIAMVLAVLAGGPALGQPTDTSLADLAGTSWRTIAIADQEVAAEVESTFEIGEAGAVSGNAGCNRYTGGAAGADADRLFGPIASTRMLCPEPLMQQEDSFLAALGETVSLGLDGEQLVLLDSDQAVLVRFAKSDA